MDYSSSSSYSRHRISENESSHQEKSFLNYLVLHYAYFVTMSVLCGVLISVIETGSIIDGIFTSTSAMSVTGLSVVDTQGLKFASQIVILILALLGSNVLMSLLPIYFRLYFFKSLAKQRDIQVENNIEYMAMRKVVIVVTLYFVLTQVLGILLVFLLSDTSHNLTETLNDRNISVVFFSIFQPISAFNNAGFSLLDDSMIQLGQQTFSLLVFSLLILMGNVGYPVALRMIFVVLKKVDKKDRKIYHYLLEHPRRCFTHLFPSNQTKWLAFTILSFTIIEIFVTIVLKNENEFLYPDYIFINAVFQSVCTRTAGFNVIDLSLTEYALQVIHVFMMYVSAYPVALSIRTSKVLPEEVWEMEQLDEYRKSFSSQARFFASRDIMWLVGGLFLISVAERPKFSADFTVWKILYEIVSSYGTVGQSLGFPGVPYSFSGEFSDISKLVMCALMILGRHRGLPEYVDRALSISGMNHQQISVSESLSAFSKSDEYSQSEYSEDSYVSVLIGPGEREETESDFE